MTLLVPMLCSKEVMAEASAQYWDMKRKQVKQDENDNDNK